MKPIWLYTLSLLCLGLAVRWMIDDANDEGTNSNLKLRFDAFDDGYAHGYEVGKRMNEAQRHTPEA